MENKIKIHANGLEQYPKAGIVLSNLAMILWIVFGTVACWLLYPPAAWIYLAFAIIMIGVVLRKLLCVNCYYYDKWCHLGWGKLSALLFPRGNINQFNVSIGQKLASLTYGLLSAIPVVLIVISLFQKFTGFKTAVLLLLLLVSFYGGTIRRKKTCAKCKMKLICPGCAVKNLNHFGK